MKELIIFGSSGHAIDIIDIFEKSKDYKIIGLIDSYRKVGDSTLGYPIIANEDNLEIVIKKHPNAEYFPAVGDNSGRFKVVSKLLNLSNSISFANAIHPNSNIGKNVLLGKGIALFSGSNISADSKIGDFSILNSNSSIGHSSVISDFSSLGPGAITGGNFYLGQYSVIGIGAFVKEKVSVGDNSIIGAGSLLLNNCPDNMIMYGHPAKLIRSRAFGDKYL